MNLYSEVLDNLYHLIEDLRLHDYGVGTAEYLSVQDLLVKLSAEGSLPTNYDDLQSLIAPLLCKSKEQQFDFPERFKNWTSSYLTAHYRQHEESNEQEFLEYDPTELKEEVRPIKRTGRIIMSGMVILLVGLFTYITIISSSGRNPDDPTPDDTSTVTEPLVPPEGENDPIDNTNANTSYTYAILIFVAGVSFFSIWGYLEKKKVRQNYLRRDQTREKFRSIDLFVPKKTSQVFRSMALLKTAQELRKHVLVESPEIDVANTVRETIKKGGLFTRIGGQRLISPEYLVLIDKSNYQDHHSQFIDSLLAELSSNEVYIDKFYFDKDPRSCFATQSGGGAFTLLDLRVKYPDHRLVIFSDGHDFINPLTEEVAQWTDQLHFWEDPTLLTLRTPDQWHHKEQALTQGRFRLLPANEKGLLGLVQEIQMNLKTEDRERDLSTTLDNNAEYWLKDDAPNGKYIDRLVQELKVYLGEAGFLWICACAVYPELNWNLTLYFGHNIKLNDDMLYCQKLLEALIRLPWFRAGRMPDWLRDRLIREIPFGQERNIRRKIFNLLGAAKDDPIAGIKLEISVQDERWIARVGRQILSSIGRSKGVEENPLQEKIFLNFMDDRLSVKIPEKFGQTVEKIVKASRKTVTVDWIWSRVFDFLWSNALVFSVLAVLMYLYTFVDSTNVIGVVSIYLMFAGLGGWLTLTLFRAMVRVFTYRFTVSAFFLSPLAITGILSVILELYDVFEFTIQGIEIMYDEAFGAFALGALLAATNTLGFGASLIGFARSKKDLKHSTSFQLVFGLLAIIVILVFKLQQGPMPTIAGVFLGLAFILSLLRRPVDPATLIIRSVGNKRLTFFGTLSQPVMARTIYYVLFAGILMAILHTTMSYQWDLAAFYQLDSDTFVILFVLVIGALAVAMRLIVQLFDSGASMNTAIRLAPGTVGALILLAIVWLINSEYTTDDGTLGLAGIGITVAGGLLYVLWSSAGTQSIIKYLHEQKQTSANYSLLNKCLFAGIVMGALFGLIVSNSPNFNVYWILLAAFIVAVFWLVTASFIKFEKKIKEKKTPKQALVRRISLVEGGLLTLILTVASPAILWENGGVELYLGLYLIATVVFMRRAQDKFVDQFPRKLTYGRIWLPGLFTGLIPAGVASIFIVISAILEADNELLLLLSGIGLVIVFVVVMLISLVVTVYSNAKVNKGQTFYHDTQKVPVEPGAQKQEQTSAFEKTVEEDRIKPPNQIKFFGIHIDEYNPLAIWATLISLLAVVGLTFQERFLSILLFQLENTKLEEFDYISLYQSALSVKLIVGVIAPLAIGYIVDRFLIRGVDVSKRLLVAFVIVGAAASILSSFFLNESLSYVLTTSLVSMAYYAVLTLLRIYILRLSNREQRIIGFGTLGILVSATLPVAHLLPEWISSVIDFTGETYMIVAIIGGVLIMLFGLTTIRRLTADSSGVSTWALDYGADQLTGKPINTGFYILCVIYLLFNLSYNMHWSPANTLLEERTEWLTINRYNISMILGIVWLVFLKRLIHRVSIKRLFIWVFIISALLGGTLPLVRSSYEVLITQVILQDSLGIVMEVLSLVILAELIPKHRMGMLLGVYFLFNALVQVVWFELQLQNVTGIMEADIVLSSVLLLVCAFLASRIRIEGGLSEYIPSSRKIYKGSMET